MGLRKDIWRPAIGHAPIERIVAQGSLEGIKLTWLPPMGSFRFLADPFGWWRDGKLHIFVEAYDYRDRRGTIEVLTYDDAFALVDRRPALSCPWHLSYPFLVETEGEMWMLPESHRSRRTTLYRSVRWPDLWEEAGDLALDMVAIDASPIFHQGRWWLFYSPMGSEEDKMGALHCAWAERLQGPWTPHPLNPVRLDLGGARPGGTPYVDGDEVVLPVQDCRHTYGGAISALHISVSPTAFSSRLDPPIRAPASAAPFVEGLHTLSAAGAVTLVDVKRTELSPHGLAIELRREVGKLRRRFSGG